MDKFSVQKCSSEKQQLVLVINTRTMAVRLPKDKLLRLVNTLTTTWLAHRKSSTLLEGVTSLAILSTLLQYTLGSGTSTAHYTAMSIIASGQTCRTYQNFSK